MTDKSNPIKPVFVNILFFIFCAVFMFLPDTGYVKGNISARNRLLLDIIVPFVLALAALMLMLQFYKKLDDSKFFIILLVIGFLLRWGYVLYNIYYLHQHDLNDFDRTDGHAGYIMWFVQNGLHLPDFDPTTRYQFYHPPLNAFLLAQLMKLLTAGGRTLDEAAECLQMFPLFLSLINMTTGISIMKEFGLSQKSLHIASAFWVMHPSFFFLSGFLNNDPLALTLTLFAVLYTCRWYKDGKFVHLMMIALGIGFGMMSKLSVGLVAVPIALVFLVVLVRRRKDRLLRLIGQYTAFGAVCVPLGLGWGIRNLLLYSVPLTFVPSADNAAIYIGDVPLLARLFGFQADCPFLSLPFFNFNHGLNAPLEYSLPSGLIKTSLFGEWPLGSNFWLGDPLDSVNLTTLLSYALFWIGCVMCLFLLFAGVSVLFHTLRHRTSITFPILSLTFLFILLIVSEVSFSIQFPYVCTQNFRYILPLLLICAVYIGLYLQQRKEQVKAFLPKCIVAVTTMFCILSASVYLSLYMQ